MKIFQLIFSNLSSSEEKVEELPTQSNTKILFEFSFTHVIKIRKRKSSEKEKL